MANVSRLSSAGVLHAFEFDDENGTNFSITGISTALSSEFDENTSSTLVSGQRMRVESTSVGNVIVFDSIDEVSSFDDINNYSNIELHLDSADSGITTVGPLPVGQQVFTE